MRQDRLASRRRTAMAYLLACLAGILVFFFLAIYPRQRSLAGLNRDIEKMETQLKEQESLSPVYQKLLTNMAPQQTGLPPFPEGDKLERHDIGQMPFIFADLARKSGLELGDVIPDVTSLAEDPGLLSVEVRMNGKFSNFRGFLMHLAQISQLESLGEFRIQSGGGVEELTVRVSLRMKP